MKIAVLDNLRSVYNVGSIFRTANAVGIEKIILCGTTPTPVDKKGEKRKDFAKKVILLSLLRCNKNNRNTLHSRWYTLFHEAKQQNKKLVS